MYDSLIYYEKRNFEERKLGWLNIKKRLQLFPMRNESYCERGTRSERSSQGQIIDWIIRGKLNGAVVCILNQKKVKILQSVDYGAFERTCTLKQCKNLGKISTL